MNKQNLAEVFSLFVSEDPGRKNLLKPFVIENLSVASDGAKMIFLNDPERSLGFEEPAPNEEKFKEKVKNSCSVSFDETKGYKTNLAELKKKFEFRLLDEEIEIESTCVKCLGTPVCPHCKENCSACEGDGVQYSYKLSGKKVVDPLFCFVLKNEVTIAATLIETLIKVLELLGIEELIYHEGGLENPQYFVLGEVTVLLMPMKNFGDNKENILVVDFGNTKAK